MAYNNQGDLDDIKSTFSLQSLPSKHQDKAKAIVYYARSLATAMVACAGPTNERAIALTSLEAAVQTYQHALENESNSDDWYRVLQQELGYVPPATKKTAVYDCRASYNDENSQRES